MRISIIILLLIACTGYAQVPATITPGIPVFGQTGTTITAGVPAAVGNITILSELFEETDSGGALGSATDGYDSDTGELGVANTETGTINPDATDRNIGATGSQSFKVTATSATGNIRFTFAAQTELRVKIKLQVDTLPTGTAQNLISLRDGSGNVQGQVAMTTDGRISIYNGSTSATTVTGGAADADYWIWAMWKSDGTAEVSWSVVDSRPTFPNSLYASVTGGNGTTAVTRLECGAETGNSLVVWFDDLYLTTLSYAP